MADRRRLVHHVGEQAAEAPVLVRECATLPARTRAEVSVGWNKEQSLFGESGAGGAAEPPAADALAGLDPALAKYLVPEGEAGLLAPGTDAATLSGALDFQGLFDQAGILNTDEVEALEKFLGGLDDTLPQSSRLAAAKAFLGAIGKAPANVLEDAERKIRVVRAVEAQKRADTDKLCASVQAEIDGLQRQIDERRSQMEAARKDLEAVRGQCATEEARLQGARVFFGAVEAAK